MRKPFPVTPCIPTKTKSFRVFMLTDTVRLRSVGCLAGRRFPRRSDVLADRLLRRRNAHNSFRFEVARSIHHPSPTVAPGSTGAAPYFASDATVNRGPGKCGAAYREDGSRTRVTTGNSSRAITCLVDSGAMGWPLPMSESWIQAALVVISSDQTSVADKRVSRTRGTPESCEIDAARCFRFRGAVCTHTTK